MNLKDAIENTKHIYMSDSSLNILLDFERVLDELDLYSFENWSKGELVDGPKIERFWVTCKFMWPHTLMPDPRGGARLLPYGCKIQYEDRTIKIPGTIESQDDFDPGTRHAKLIDMRVWFVEIQMPQELITDVEQGSLEIAGEDIDIEDLQGAYQQGLDQNANQKNSGQQDQLQGQGQQAPQGGAGQGQQGMGGGGGMGGMGGGAMGDPMGGGF